MLIKIHFIKSSFVGLLINRSFFFGLSRTYELVKRVEVLCLSFPIETINRMDSDIFAFKCVKVSFYCEKRLNKNRIIDGSKKTVLIKKIDYNVWKKKIIYELFYLVTCLSFCLMWKRNDVYESVITILKERKNVRW
jgi:hypothetical protein